VLALAAAEHADGLFCVGPVEQLRDDGGDVGDPLLQEVTDPSGLVLEEAHRIARIDVLP
jgi:hypothetical protein